MPSATYHLFRNAILAEKQVVCSYEGRHRELCPHIIGTNKNGEEVVLGMAVRRPEFRQAAAMAMLETGQCQGCPRTQRPLARRRLAPDGTDLRQPDRTRHQHSCSQIA